MSEREEGGEVDGSRDFENGRRKGGGRGICASIPKNVHFAVHYLRNVSPKLPTKCRGRGRGREEGAGRWGGGGLWVAT